MRQLYNLLLVAFVAITLSGCNRNKQPELLYDINISERVICAFDGQTVEVEYSLQNLADNVAEVNITATTDASWITNIDTSTAKLLRITIEENSAETRNAEITIKADGYKATTFRLTQYGTPPEVATHTLMYFFFGTSLNRYFKTNLQDAALAIETGILGNSNRVVFFRQQNNQSAYIGELCFDINSGECIERKIEDDIDIGGKQLTPEDIGHYIKKMSKAAPANRYGLVLAGHGQGWVTCSILNGGATTFSAGGYSPWIQAAGAETTRAFGEANVRVDIPQIAEGIEHSGVMLDYLLFDACFMSNIETVYDLRNSANYIIASPCEIMGRGFPYERTLPYLFEDEGSTTNYIKATESYYNYYRDEYVGSARCGSIALFDCSKIEALAEATAELVKTAKSDYDTSSLQTYEGQDPHHFYDFGEWAGIVATDSKALDNFNTALQECVIAKYTLPEFYSAYGSYGTYPINEEVYSGVTTSAPSTAFPNGWKQTNWYKEVFE